MVSARTIKEINPLFWVAMAFVLISYILRAREGPVPDDISTYHALAAVVLVALMFITKEQKLLTIREAQTIAYFDAITTELEGRMEDSGRLSIVEDGVLRRVGDKPRSIDVALKIEGKPKVIVYSIQPYTGYILRTSKRQEWTSMDEPDIKVIVPPTIQEWDVLRKKLGLGDVENAPV